jgi:hypothetical protein
MRIATESPVDFVNDVGFGRILDRKAPVEELVGLLVQAGQLAMRIILFREKAARAENHAIQPVIEKMQPTQSLGGKLCHPIDVARHERP